MKELFKTEYKNKLVKIFVPIMLSNLISQIQMFIDRIFLGRMNILYIVFLYILFGEEIV